MVSVMFDGLHLEFQTFALHFAGEHDWESNEKLIKYPACRCMWSRATTNVAKGSEPVENILFPCFPGASG